MDENNDSLRRLGQGKILPGCHRGILQKAESLLQNGDH